MIRLFVALDLPQETRDELGSFCYGVPGARWLSDDQFHLTLHFIGDVDGALYGDICESLDDVRSENLHIRLSGLGFFSQRKEPKVLWVGLERNEALVQLRNRIGAGLKRAGVELERRKFSPHITVARLRNSPKSKLMTFVAAHNLYKSSNVEISEFKLYSSVLTSNGAIHSVEEEFKLF